jgi:hypothetical protein
MDQISHWDFIGMIASGYPEKPDYQEVQDYMEFFRSLRYVIPSFSYRTHYDQYITNRPIDSYLNNKSTLVAWVLGLHPSLPVALIQSVKPEETMAKIWGYLLSIAKHFPNQPSFQEVIYYRDFFLSLQNVMPFRSERKKYTEQFQKIPIDRYMISNEFLQQWVTLMYQEVRKSTVIEGFSKSDSLTMLVTVMILCGIYYCVGK